MAKPKNSPVFATGQPISFTLDTEQVRLANDWSVRHRCARAGQYGSAGDKFNFHFCPSGIGTFVSIHCSCGKSKDITGSL